MNKPVVKIDKFVRKNTQSVDVETLNQKGVTRVNFLTLSKINEMIALAVQRAVVKYQRSLDAADAGRIHEEARAEVAEELKRTGKPPEPAPAGESRIPHPPEPSPPPPLSVPPAVEGPPVSPGSVAAQATVGGAAAEGTASDGAASEKIASEGSPERLSAPTALETRPPAPVAPGVVSADRLGEVEECIHRMLRDLLSRECPLHVLPDGGTTPADMKRLERQLQSAVSRALAAERERLMEAIEEAAAYRTELLERRLEKVKQKLREMEDRLHRLATEKGIDPGLLSVYREIQGLSLLDGQYEKKKGMLQLIFEENVQLQKIGGKQAV